MNQSLRFWKITRPSFRFGWVLVCAAFLATALFVVWGLSADRPAPGPRAQSAMLQPAANKPAPADLPEVVTFNEHIRPILSENCFLCHGPDERMRKETGGLRLDIREEAVADGAIVPGDPDASLLIQRITSESRKQVMPPPSSHLSLTREEIELLTAWVEQGAVYAEHWAFVAPTRPALPDAGADWAKNPIDRFLFEKMEGHGLRPNPEADKATLIRRVALALTGLPPTPEEVDVFLADDASDAYEKMVDRLLASERFGEHQARYWLDAVRYADTHGLHLDNHRSVWPYRDWVISAFNQNKPFDQFVHEQLAGDLLPDPTLDQLVASGFVRMNPTTGEGGAIDEEYLVKYAVDRVDTVSTVFLGMTVACAQCHDHKYDPVSQREFYELYAYFNSTAEAAMDKNALAPPPSIRVPTQEQKDRVAALQAQAAGIDTKIQELVASIAYVEPADAGDRSDVELPAEVVWVEDDAPAGAKLSGDGPAPQWQWVGGPDHPVHSGSRSLLRRGSGLIQNFFTGVTAPITIREGDTLFAWVYLDPKDAPQVVQLQFNNGSWDHRARWGANVAHGQALSGVGNHDAGPLPATGEWVKLEVAAADVGLKPGDRVNGMAFTQHGGTVYYDRAGVLTMHPPDDRYKLSRSIWEGQAAGDKSVPGAIQNLLKIARADRTAEQDQQVLAYYLREVHGPTRERVAPLEADRDALLAEAMQIENSAPLTLVAKELSQPRPAFVLDRGEYDRPGERVERGVPAVLPPLPEGAPNNRLGFALWLTDPGHPLTARVAVNRIWQQYFGTGLVQTPEDFGSQGSWPSHMGLLDWLAVEFIESGWDVKHMHRLIVTSAAFRQTARFAPAQATADIPNRLLARAPRFRLDAEVVRDQALYASGLLVETVGGPSVKPYQPSGLWEAVGYTDSNTAKFVQDTGDSLYRRSMYTFWKRTSPPPSLSLFDAPAREACTVRRSRTNTPLQALATLNDVQFVEAARALAQRAITQRAGDVDAQIRYAFRLAAVRVPAEDELAILSSIYAEQLQHYKEHPGEAAQLIAAGASKADPAIPAPELAAMTVVTNTILNLDEVLTQH